MISTAKGKSGGFALILLTLSAFAAISHTPRLPPGIKTLSGIVSLSTSLYLFTNSEATYTSTFINDTSIEKAGTGIYHLSFSSTFATSVSVTAGTLDVVNGSLFFSNVSLANQGVLTVPSSLAVKSFSGGGIVRPRGLGGTIIIGGLSSGGLFSGVFEGNGAAGKLSLVFSQTAQTLSGESSYSGTTNISSASTVSLTGSGSILSTPEITLGGTLHLNSSDTANSNRISDATRILLQGGTFRLTGNSASVVEEAIGTVDFSNSSDIVATAPGLAVAKLTIANLNRLGSGTLTFGGTGTISANVANLPSGILQPYLTSSNEWAVRSAEGTISAFSGYVSDINSATAGSHVKLASPGTTQLAETSSRATLNFQNASSSIQTLDLGSFDLTLGDGGILSSGTKGSAIENGRLRGIGQELVVTNRNDLVISASIAEGGSAMSLTKSGAGVLTLNGSNSYAGNTTVQEGTLSISSDGNLGSGAKVTLNGSSLRITGSVVSPKSLEGSGTVEVVGSNSASFVGGHSTSLFKTGSGKLVLENHSSDYLSLSAGSLTLRDSPLKQLNVQAGQLLDAIGNIDSLGIVSLYNLEIGSDAAGILKTGGFLAMNTVNVFFDLGASESDRIDVTRNYGLDLETGGKLNFTFRNLGGVTMGQDYLLISTLAGWSATLSNFGFSAPSIAAGWAGTFEKTAQGLSVRFTSVPAPVPEPASIALLCLGVGILFVRHRRNS